MAKPESGRLAVHEDLESLGLNLLDWLNITSPGKLGVTDP